MHIDNNPFFAYIFSTGNVMRNALFSTLCLALVWCASCEVRSFHKQSHTTSVKTIVTKKKFRFFGRETVICKKSAHCLTFYSVYMFSSSNIDMRMHALQMHSKSLPMMQCTFCKRPFDAQQYHSHTAYGGCKERTNRKKTFAQWICGKRAHFGPTIELSHLLQSNQM